MGANLAKASRSHTTSLISGDDCVPCLSLATALDFRDSLVCVLDPVTHGLAPSFRVSDLADAAERYDIEHLVKVHDTIRKKAGLNPGRLYPSGRLIYLKDGSNPTEVEHSSVDELILTSDMFFAHKPRRYLAALQAADLLNAGKHS